MNAKNEISKILKDLQHSAREFAHYGLQASSKALDATATKLGSLRDELSKTAERFVDDEHTDQASE